jgi:hypothetical protein
VFPLLTVLLRRVFGLPRDLGEGGVVIVCFEEGVGDQTLLDTRRDLSRRH